MSEAGPGAAGSWWVQGKALVLGDDISTDLIYPGRYLTLADRTEQATHALEGMGPDWPARLAAHTILAAGWNFGCGSSREQAATALLGAGIRLVVARSLSRIFLRNCINNGLPIIESPPLIDALSTGTTLRADMATGIAHVGDRTITFDCLPPPLLRIIEAGGLLAQLKAEPTS